MHCLSLVDCLEVKFNGKILKEAICLGDCNNDGLSELVVGNTDGDLFIYRGDRCIAKSCDLGTISAITVGDLINISRNITLVFTVEGWCHIFDVEYELNTEDGKDDYSSTDASASITDFKMIQPFHSQRIVCNIKVAKIGDIYNDGRPKLIVALTDRVLRSYQWYSELDEINRREHDEKVADDQRSELTDLAYNGKLEALTKWEFANQVGTIALHKDNNKGTCILVGQPGGTVSKIYRTVEESKQEIDEIPQNVSDNISLSDSFVMQHYPLNLAKTQNPDTSTEVVGNILAFGSEEKADHYAVATLDGVVMLCHEDSFEIITRLQSPVLALEACNGYFVIIGWEGETYLVKRTLDPEVEKCIVQFNFEETAAGFKVGPYAIPHKDHEDGINLENQNCFVYVTYHDSIYIYPNEHL